MTSATDLPAEIRLQANQRLDRIERDHGVRVLFAIESGSRAWGFPSPDSDLDVRFVYLRPLDRYLRLEPVRDVIEAPIEGDWDVNGWDLRKALILLSRGNAVVVEWLRSPLVYREVGPVPGELRRLADRFASPDLSIRHYYGLLNGVWRRDFEGRTTTKLKKYFYAVRAAAALAWVRYVATTPPMDLPTLLDPRAVPQLVRDELARLLEIKMRTSEVGEGPRIAVLDAFVEDQMAWALDRLARQASSDPQFGQALDALFMRAVGIDPPPDKPLTA